MKKVQKTKVVRKAPSLKSIFVLDTNTDNYVVLKVKPGKGMDLIRCGFRGTEKIARIHKGHSVSVTFFFRDGDINEGSYEKNPLSPILEARYSIVNFVENDLKIPCFVA